MLNKVSHGVRVRKGSKFELKDLLMGFNCCNKGVCLVFTRVSAYILVGIVSAYKKETTQND